MGVKDHFFWLLRGRRDEEAAPGKGSPILMWVAVLVGSQWVRLEPPFCRRLGHRQGSPPPLLLFLLSGPLLPGKKLWNLTQIVAVY